MEPASIVTCITAALKATNQAYSIITSFRNAPKQLTPLGRALQSLTLVLEMIRDDTNQYRAATSAHKTALQDCRDDVAEIAVRLQGLTVADGDGRARRMLKRVKFVMAEKEIPIMYHRINGHKLTLLIWFPYCIRDDPSLVAERQSAARMLIEWRDPELAVKVAEIVAEVAQISAAAAAEEEERIGRGMEIVPWHPPVLSISPETVEELGRCVQRLAGLGQKWSLGSGSSSAQDIEEDEGQSGRHVKCEKPSGLDIPSDIAETVFLEKNWEVDKVETNNIVQMHALARELYGHSIAVARAQQLASRWGSRTQQEQHQGRAEKRDALQSHMRATVFSWYRRDDWEAEELMLLHQIFSLVPGPHF